MTGNVPQGIESGWLVQTLEESPVMYLDGIEPDSFTREAADAIRFARERDGKKVLYRLRLKGLQRACVVVEHRWGMV